MSDKYLTMDEDLYNYVLTAYSGKNDTLMNELEAETLALGDESRMLISREQGMFLQLLVAVSGAKTIVEVGTFTGCSSLHMAQGMQGEGKIYCFDLDKRCPAIAQKYWEKAGVTDKIELINGNAHKTLHDLPDDLVIDLVFIDADKQGYEDYLETLFPKVRKGGIMLFDNMLWGGRVAREQDVDNETAAIRKLNNKLTEDPRFENVLLPFADGIQMCRKV